MNENYIGYACINETLSKNGIRVNRGLTKKTFEKKGLEYVGELIENNLKDLAKILEWNINYGIYHYRMSSAMFPWKTKYELEELPNFPTIKRLLGGLGSMILVNNMRVSFHPDHFTILASPKENVVEESIKEINTTSKIMDLMGFPKSPQFKINVHVGGTYGDKEKACDRFCENYNKLDGNAKKRLTVENDDKKNGYTVNDLYNLIYKKINIPIVFDYHHHSINNGDMGEEEGLKLAISTWSDGIRPVVHYSDSKKLYEDNSAKLQAHSDYVYEDFDLYEQDVDVIFEAKLKEIAVVNYKVQKGYMVINKE